MNEREREMRGGREKGRMRERGDIGEKEIERVQRGRDGREIERERERRGREETVAAARGGGKAGPTLVLGIKFLIDSVQ